MKKVLISAYTCCPNRGSEPGNGWNWIMGYAANDYHVYCITSGKYRSKIESFCKANNTKKIEFYFTDNKFSLAFFRIPLFGVYLHYYIWLWMARKKINELTKNTPFSHAHHVTYSSIKFGTPIYGLPFKSILGPLGGGELPHPTLRKYLGKYYYFEYFKNKLGNTLATINPAVARSVKTADMILVSNDTARHTIQKYSDKEMIRMYDAGLAEYFQKPYYSRNIRGTINILWIGRILPRKGLNLAIEAIAHLPEKLNFHFNIVGEGSLEGEARVLVEKLDLGSRVTFLGKLPHEEITSVLEKSHLFLFPSLIDSCPMQVFEALASGLPVVTLNHQGMKDQVIEGAGIKIEVGHGIDYPAELAKGILYIIRDHKVYNEISSTAYQFGQEQIWKKRIKRFLNNLYQ